MDVKKKLRFNLFDALIIALVLAALAGALLLRNRSTGADVARENIPVRLTVEMLATPVGMEESFHVGEEVFRSTDGAYLGTVYAVEKKPHRAIVYHQAQARFISFDCEDSSDLYLTIDCDGYFTEKCLMVNSLEIRVGGEMPVKGKGFAKMAYIYAIDTLGAEPPANKAVGSGELEATYVFRFDSVRNVLLGCLRVGDRLYEKSTGALMGEILDIWTEPYGETALDADGKAVYVEREDASYIYLRVRGRAVEKRDGYYLDGGTELKVGATARTQSMFSDRTGTYYRLESMERVS